MLFGYLFVVLGWSSAFYLAARAGVVLLRVHRARHAYPVVAVDAPESGWANRCRGVLVGLAIGDALNMPAESLPRWLVRCRYPSGPAMRRGLVRFARRAGDVSDDTQLAIAVARSIEPDGRYDHREFLRELGKWSGYRVGAGRACRVAAAAARQGIDERRSIASEGNGAAIRVAPIAMAAVSTGRELEAAVRENARGTHDSDAAASAAVFVACLVRDALAAERGRYASRGHRTRALEAAAEAASFPAVTDAVERFGHLPVQRALAACGTSGHVLQSVPAAALVLLDAGLDFRSAMRTIFYAGGDTDSIGSIVGSVIGAQVGESRLPTEWVGAVQHRDYLRWLAERLATPDEPASDRRPEAGASLHGEGLCPR